MSKGSNSKYIFCNSTLKADCFIIKFSVDNLHSNFPLLYGTSIAIGISVDVLNLLSKLIFVFSTRIFFLIFLAIPIKVTSIGLYRFENRNFSPCVLQETHQSHLFLFYDNL